MRRYNKKRKPKHWVRGRWRDGKLRLKCSKKKCHTWINNFIFLTAIGHIMVERYKEYTWE